VVTDAVGELGAVVASLFELVTTVPVEVLSPVVVSTSVVALPVVSCIPVVREQSQVCAVSEQL
jgi:hypothetical protein